MDAVKFLEALNRSCSDKCDQCPLFHERLCFLVFGFKNAALNPEKVIRQVEELAKRSPSPKRKPVKIVADEIIRVFTVDILCPKPIVVGYSFEIQNDSELKEEGRKVCEEIQKAAENSLYGRFDDVLCVGAKQRIMPTSYCCNHNFVLHRIFTIELTCIVQGEKEEEEMELFDRGYRIGEQLNDALKDYNSPIRIGYYVVKNAQQFITRFHEEEIAP